MLRQIVACLLARLRDEELLRRYHLTRSQENLLVFHEDENSPVASIAVS